MLRLNLAKSPRLDQIILLPILIKKLWVVSTCYDNKQGALIVRFDWTKKGHRHCSRWSQILYKINQPFNYLLSDCGVCLRGRERTWKMSSKYRQNVVKISSKCRQNFIKMSSKCRQNIVNRSSKCRQNDVKMPSKFGKF